MRRRPAIPAPAFRRFMTIVRRLRRECPWDREQTHRSLRQGLIEEAYEVVETLDHDDIAELKNELGDLLLHIALHATIAEEEREFTMQDLLDSTCEKLIRRHPHVFGDLRLRNAGEVVHTWEKLKMAEGRSSVLQGIPRRLPALQKAMRVQQRAAKVGFDWTHERDVWAKVREELEEFRRALAGKNHRKREEEFGDLLFALVNYARFVRVHPEDALRHTIDKFIRRFRHIENELRRRGKDIHASTLEEMDALWNEDKRLHAPRRRARNGMRTGNGNRGTRTVQRKT